MKLAKTLILLTLILSTNAYADFRKALVALQKTQGTEMLVAIEDAVKTKNNDGLSILLGTLSDRLMNDEFFTTIAKGEHFFIDGRENENKLLLGKNNIPELMSLLEQAASNADIETQFDFAVLKSKFNNKENRWNVSDEELETFSKLGVKKAENILSSKRLNRFYSNKQPDLLAEFEILKKSAELGNIDSAARLAIIYLKWLPYEQSPDRVFFKEIPTNNKKGIYWLKRYAANASLGDYAGPCKLADEYYSGDKIKKDIKQAYLWYMQSTFNSGWGIEDCTMDGLRNMAYTGDLEQLNAKLAQLLKEEDREQLRSYIHNLSGKLKSPRDLVLLKNPLNKELLYSVRENRYSLEVYKSGKVKFEGFGNYIAPNVRVAINSFLVGRDEWTISNKELQELSRQLNALDIGLAKNYMLESVLCDTGEHWRYGLININTNKLSKTIGYSTVRHTFNTPILAKIFKIQESIVPTQHLRCGIQREDNNYKNCVAEDVYNFKQADESQ